MSTAAISGSTRPRTPATGSATTRGARRRRRSAPALPLSEAPRTLADLLQRLGGVSPDRVLMDPPPGTATVRDALRLTERDKILCELIDRTLVRKAMGFEESEVGILIGYFLVGFVRPRKLGTVAGADCTIKPVPGQLRLPDVAFFSNENLRKNRKKGQRAPRISPDLAVEVLSEKNTPAEIARKLGEFFRGGTRLAWIVDPRKRTVRVHAAPAVSRLLGESDTLDGGDVLPGFSILVRELFPVDE